MVEILAVNKIFSASKSIGLPSLSFPFLICRWWILVVAVSLMISMGGAAILFALFRRYARSSLDLASLVFVRSDEHAYGVVAAIVLFVELGWSVASTQGLQLLLSLGPDVFDAASSFCEGKDDEVASPRAAVRWTWSDCPTIFAVLSAVRVSSSLLRLPMLGLLDVDVRLRRDAKPAVLLVMEGLGARRGALGCWSMQDVELSQCAVGWVDRLRATLVS
jgi:hypothetical protein